MPKEAGGAGMPTLNDTCQRLESLIQALPDIVCVLDPGLHLVLWNRRLEEATGRPPERLRGQSLLTLFPEPARPGVTESTRTALDQGCAEFDAEVTAADGVRAPHHFTLTRLTGSGEAPIGLSAVGREVAARPRLQRELQQSEAHFRVLAERSPTGVGLYRERFLYVNPSMSRITGYRREELLTLHPGDLIVEAVIPDEQAAGQMEWRLRTKRGDECWVYGAESTVPYRGGSAWLINWTDITGKKHLEEQLRGMATVDGLTGLYNRAEIERRVGVEMARVDRYGGRFSLILFDIDRFKEINDRLGHQGGDQVLRSLAALLRRDVRASDHVGRWGGEEFLVVVPAMGLSEATGFAVKLRLAIAGYPFVSSAPVTASFGVAEFRRGEPLDALIQRADEALYRAKRKGRDRVETE